MSVSAIPESTSPDGERPSFVSRVTVQASELKRVAWLFGLWLASSMVLIVIAKFNPSPWPEVIVSAVVALVVLVFAASRFDDVRPLLVLPRTSARDGMQNAGIALGIFAALFVYFALLGAVGIPVVSMTENYVAAGWPLWAIFAMMSAIPAVFEELGFRGIIQGSLARIFGPRETWVIQAALFSVLHLSPIVFPSHFLMGLLFGWLRNRTGSLVPSAVAHASWNALAVCEELYWPNMF